MQTITVTGGVGRDAELRSTQRGDQVCSFYVGVNQGYGDKKSTNWYRVSLWGKRGESLQPYLLKGVKVAISGEFETSEYEGKTQLNIRANEEDIMSSRIDQNESGGKRKREGMGGNSLPKQEQLEDAVPTYTRDLHGDDPRRPVTQRSSGT